MTDFCSVARTDLQFPWSCEETELCMRARKLIGMGEFMFVPRALVWHRIPTRRLSFRYFCLRCYAEGMSKAYVSALRTSTDTLSAERSYVRGGSRSASCAASDTPFCALIHKELHVPLQSP
jgi:glucosyl-dolichyl phosphate glucuronosyltransferase